MHFNEARADYDHLFDRTGSEVMQARRRFLEFCEVNAGARVLEIGAGSGLFTIEAGLAERVGPQGEVCAVDPSPEMIAVARRRAGGRGLRNVRFLAGRSDAAYRDQSFDAVVGSLALSAASARAALAEARRLLVPGGTIALYWGLPLDSGTFRDLPPGCPAGESRPERRR